MNTINVKIIQRTDTSENWDLHNPILDNGEIGYDIDKKTFKIGNGSSTWTSLPYYNEIIDGGDYIPVKSPAMLAKNDTWYKGSVARSTITSINIVDSADDATIATADESWAAGGDFNKDGENDDSVMCYVNGTELTIAGDGSGKIYLNPDSASAFAKFTETKTFSNANLLDASKVNDMTTLFSQCTSLTSIDVSDWDTSNVVSMAALFQACISLEEVDLSKWNVSKVTTMQNMFFSNDSFGLMNITSIGDTSNWNTKSLTNTSYMFYYCPELTSVDTSNWNTSEITTMQSMFYNCSALASIGDTANWNTENVKYMNHMFYKCSNLESVDTTNWATNNVLNMKSMFYNCSSLTSIGDTTNWSTENVTVMDYMFNNCNKLTYINTTNWNTKNVTSTKCMFNECNLLNTLNVSNWNTGKVTSMEGMFCNCSSLTSIGSTTNWDTSNVTNMSYMFDNCSSLEYLDVSNWDVSNVTSISSMFSGGSNGANPFKPTLDVSKWDTSNVTDMSFAFYSQKSGKTLDLRNWDTSKVTTFDHFMAHSSITLAGGQDAVKNWDTSSCINMNAMFYTCRNTVLDLSHFDTSKVTIFDQMFEASALKQIIGMDKWNTSNGVGFSEMFWNNGSIEEVDLSSFDTRKAKNGVTASDNKTKTSTLEGFFRDDATYGPKKLKKVILGENFSFNGDGTNTSEANKFKMPSVSVIGSDTYWQAEDGTIYAPNEVPDKTYGVYIAVSNPNQS